MKNVTSFLGEKTAQTVIFPKIGPRVNINIGSILGSLGDFTYTTNGSRLLLDLNASAVYIM